MYPVQVKVGKVKLMNQSTQTQNNEFPLLELPRVVIDNILSFLPPKTCLTLRRVCKTTLKWVSNLPFSTQEIAKWKRFQLPITGKGFRTFSSAAKINLPLTSFRIQNLYCKTRIYESEGVKDFIKLYKNRQSSFSVDVLCMLQLPKERKFFVSFKNLYELKIYKLRSCLPHDKLRVCEDSGSNYRAKLLESFSRPPVPLVSSLRRLVIKECDRLWIPTQVTDQFILEFILSFKNLEYLCPPSKLKKFIDVSFPWIFQPRKSTYCPEWMDTLGTALINNNWNNVSKIDESKHNLRNQAVSTSIEGDQFYLDLRSFTKTKYSKRAYPSYVEYYVRLLQESYQRNILFYNVYSPLLEAMYEQWLELGWTLNMIYHAFQFFENIVTLSVSGNVLLFGFSEMKRLEDISIFHDMGDHLWLYHNPPKHSWPHLKTMKLSMLIREKDLSVVSTDVWGLTFRRLFKTPNRSSVTNLTLKMSSECKNKGSESERKMMDFHEQMFNVPIITKNFANLKCLTIHGWLVSNDMFHELFKGLRKLEYVHIGACRLLNDFGLKNISRVKTLVLNLNDMPLFTENLFIHVLSYMPLKELRIYGQKSLKQITKKAILALQQGVFGRNIEKFPFHTWKSKYIKEKEKTQLQKGFRCMP